MPTEMTRSSAPTTRHARASGPGSRDVKPLSLTALAIIAVLILILHLTVSASLDRSHAHASVVAPDDDAKCPMDVEVPSLPFD